MPRSQLPCGEVYEIVPFSSTEAQRRCANILGLKFLDLRQVLRHSKSEDSVCVCVCVY